MAKYERLVRTEDNGLNCLCFSNKARLSVVEITEIFSKYGKVISVNCPGGEQSYRFVRFQTKEEALQCAIGLDGHSQIRLEPVKSNSKESTVSNHQFTRKYQENINEQRNVEKRFNAEQTERADSTKGSQSSRKSQTNNNQTQKRDNRVENGFGAGKNMNNLNPKIKDEHSVTWRSGTSHQNSGSNYANSRPNANFQRTNGSEDNNHEIRISNNHTNMNKLEQLHKLRGTISNSFQPLSNDPTYNLSSLPAAPTSLAINPVPPSSQDSSKERPVMTDMPPPLVSSVCSRAFGRGDIPEERIEVLLACGVIVANIHSNIGVSNIYHMFRKFGPIYVSDIETVADIDVRFCHVYFERPKDALAVEQSFDGISVCGKNLIALRPERIEVETGIF